MKNINGNKKKITVLMQDATVHLDILKHLKPNYNLTFNKSNRADVGVSISGNDFTLTLLNDNFMTKASTPYERTAQKVTSLDCTRWIEQGNLTMGEILKSVINEIITFPY